MPFPVLKLDKPMTVAEFLAWDSGDDRIWELHDGYPILKDGWGPKGHAAPSPAHNALTAELGYHLTNAIRTHRLPCRVEPGSGVYRDPDRTKGFYVPDLLVRCGGQRGERVVLVAELLSPGNTVSEMMRKDSFYRDMPGLLDILFIDATDPIIRHWRRGGDGEAWQMLDLTGLGTMITLASLPLELRLQELYRIVAPGWDQEETP